MISIADKLTVERFSEKMGKWLEQSEAENNLILGIISNLLQKPPAERQEHYLLAVEEGTTLLGAAVWTPPYKLTVTLMPERAVSALVDHLLAHVPFLPGVGGPKETAARLVENWGQKSPLLPAVDKSLRLYQLKEVTPLPKSPGKMRAATKEDLERLADWHEKFHQEIKTHEIVDHRKLLEGLIRERRLLVWEDSKIVAMTGFSGNTAHGARLNVVYTPPRYRKKGYASSLTAAASQRLLDSGKKFCVLYADLSNLTSNGIYQKIGYHPVCDWDVYNFK
jgi:predicted GNAT family acetyltransferase